MGNTFKPTHRHIKTGGEYRVIGNAIAVSRGAILENEVVAVYEAADGSWFVRSRSEFFDGRFERIAPGGEQ
jgi:hypothetical protein